MFFGNPGPSLAGHGIEHGLDDLHGPLHQADFLGALDQAHVLHQRRRIHQVRFGKALPDALDGGVGNQTVRRPDQPGELQEIADGPVLTEYSKSHFQLVTNDDGARVPVAL